MSSTTEAVRLAAHAPARALTCIALRVGAHTLWHKPRQQALRGRLHACAGMHVCRLRAGEHACLPSRHRTACLHCLLTRRGLARLDTTPYPVQAQGPGRACLRGLPALRRPRTHTRGWRRHRPGPRQRAPPPASPAARVPCQALLLALQRGVLPQQARGLCAARPPLVQRGAALPGAQGRRGGQVRCAAVNLPIRVVGCVWSCPRCRRGRCLLPMAIGFSCRPFPRCTDDAALTAGALPSALPPSALRPPSMRPPLSFCPAGAAKAAACRRRC